MFLSLGLLNPNLLDSKDSSLMMGKGRHCSIPIPPNPQSNQALKELQSYF